MYTSLALFPYVGSSASVAVTWIMDVPEGEEGAEGRKIGGGDERGRTRRKGGREERVETVWLSRTGCSRTRRKL